MLSCELWRNGDIKQCHVLGLGLRVHTTNSSTHLLTAACKATMASSLTRFRASVWINHHDSINHPRIISSSKRKRDDLRFDIYLGHGHPPAHLGTPSDIFFDARTRVFVKTWDGWVLWQIGQHPKWPQRPNHYLAATRKHALYFIENRGITWCRPNINSRHSTSRDKNHIYDIGEMIDITVATWRSKPETVDEFVPDDDDAYNMQMDTSEDGAIAMVPDPVPQLQRQPEQQHHEEEEEEESDEDQGQQTMLDYQQDPTMLEQQQQQAMLEQQQQQTMLDHQQQQALLEYQAEQQAQQEQQQAILEHQQQQAILELEQQTLLDQQQQHAFLEHQMEQQQYEEAIMEQQQQQQQAQEQQFEDDPMAGSFRPL